MTDEVEIHKATPHSEHSTSEDNGREHCEHCGQRIRVVPGGNGATWVHSDSGAVVAPNPPGMKFEIPGFGEVLAYASPIDGVTVVEIDSTEATEAAGTCDGRGLPRLRVYVNDDPVWEHPPVPTD